LGLIETIGLAAAVEAADIAVKSANVELVGYELAKGDGMTTVKLLGDVGAVKAAVDSAKAAAALVNKVYSTQVIPRPAAGLEHLVYSRDTVGLETKEPETPPTPEPPAPTEKPENTAEAEKSVAMDAETMEVKTTAPEKPAETVQAEEAKKAAPSKKPAPPKKAEPKKQLKADGPEKDGNNEKQDN